MKTMQEVLAEHGEWRYTNGAGSAIVCRKCGAPVENVVDHQAVALSAAGFGLVADAKAEAWDEGWAARAWRDPVYRVPDTNPYRATP